jgi:hypothetical protein
VRQRPQVKFYLWLNLWNCYQKNLYARVLWFSALNSLKFSKRW